MSYSHTVAEAGRAALQTYCWIRLTGKAHTLMLGRVAFSDDANEWEISLSMYVLNDCSLHWLCSAKQKRGIFTGSLPILRPSQAIDRWLTATHCMFAVFHLCAVFRDQAVNRTRTMGTTSSFSSPEIQSPTM